MAESEATEELAVLMNLKVIVKKDDFSTPVNGYESRLFLCI
ncbi:hypothetical protein EAL2_808p03360 (plasmid) [Peptoclostridium acidaminophilum DSM 3953]|uniref:Uncharacterized protein n=1 Tax=Peptoclostridium acidaminophilum DSM 3953 TaxID=1286171 RepID=W8UAL4_PEPAC|nr:hypothetical protein EAL2_808p03360 [Peptoclostridium acidaminophilum DSM 3953]